MVLVGPGFHPKQSATLDQLGICACGKLAAGYRFLVIMATFEYQEARSKAAGYK
jgi:hypothetical protein